MKEKVVIDKHLDAEAIGGVVGLDMDISRTISYYDGLLIEDIDSMNEFDYLFDVNFQSRSKAVLKFIGRGSNR